MTSGAVPPHSVVFVYPFLTQLKWQKLRCRDYSNYVLESLKVSDRAPVKKRASVQPAASLNARGLRSRIRLKDAAKSVLNERGYRNMRVQDVTERAGVANGLFYRYFHDSREIAAEVSSDLFDTLIAEADSLEIPDEAYDWIVANLGIVVRLFAKNPGILACLFGLAGDYEEFGAIWKKNAHKWNLQVADFLRQKAGFEPDNAEFTGYVLGAMTEGVLYQSLIRRTEDLFEFGEKPEHIAEIIAVMWYRAIFMADPPAEKLISPGFHLTNGQRER